MPFTNPVNATEVGFQSITAGARWRGRTLIAGTGITIVNGDGTTGNPTISANGGIPYISLSPFIVGTDSNSGYATIAAGIAAAVAAGATNATPMNVYVKPKEDGTAYTENLTLEPGVNLIGFGQSPSITGKLSYTQAGSVIISDLTLKTNSDFYLAITGSSASKVYLNNCNVINSNNTGISFTSSSSNSGITLKNCIGDLLTTGIAIFSHSSSGALTFFNCDFFNSGGTSTASTCSAGNLFIRRTYFASPVTTSGTATFSSAFAQWDSSAENVTAFVSGGSGQHFFLHSQFFSGTASAVSISNTSYITLANVNSSNTNTLTGAGTLNYGFIVFTGSSSGHNVTIENALATLI